MESTHATTFNKNSRMTWSRPRAKRFCAAPPRQCRDQQKERTIFTAVICHSPDGAFGSTNACLPSTRTMTEAIADGRSSDRSIQTVALMLTRWQRAKNKWTNRSWGSWGPLKDPRGCFLGSIRFEVRRKLSGQIDLGDHVGPMTDLLGLQNGSSRASTRPRIS